MFYIQYTYKVINTNVYNDYSFIAKLESTWLFGISELFSCTVLILYWQNLPWNWSVQRQTGSPIRVPLLEYTHSSSPPFMHLIKNIKFINFLRNKYSVIYDAWEFKDHCTKFILSVSSHSWFPQGVWNRREIQLTRPALPYDYTCFADGTSFE